MTSDDVRGETRGGEEESRLEVREDTEIVRLWPVTEEGREESRTGIGGMGCEGGSRRDVLALGWTGGKGGGWEAEGMSIIYSNRGLTTTHEAGRGAGEVTRPACYLSFDWSVLLLAHPALSTAPQRPETHPSWTIQASLGYVNARSSLVIQIGATLT